MWAVLKQLLSTNWLNKSAVKREVSLVSFRNFWFFVVWGQMVRRVSRHIRNVCCQMAWESPFFVCLSSLCFDVKQGISLTTWMVVGETDKWNTNFKFFCHFFLLFTMLSGNYVWNGILLFWRKQIIPFVLLVFFFWAFVFVTKIYICPKDLLLLSIINEMS